MHIIRLDDCGTRCHVAVPGVFNGRLMDGESGLDAALEEAFCREYFAMDDSGPIDRTRLAPDENLAINFDGTVIEHAVADWCLIYDGIISKPVIISQSEY